MDLLSHSFDMLMAPLEASSLRRRREALIGRAAGRVLEVGAGTGANLSHYREANLEEVTVSDVELRPAVLTRGADVGIAHHGDDGNHGTNGTRAMLRFRRTAVENLPFPDAYFDTVVSTLVFCSVTDPYEGLRQVRRVLKPGGKFLFIEHILPEHGPAQPLFNAVTPVWKHLAGGCHLNRRTVRFIRESGFLIEEMRYFANGAFVEGIAEKPVDVEPVLL
ncbi:MAG: class I SAM-dependent methyltransferase [Spirochaetaceae bacterium]